MQPRLVDLLLALLHHRFVLSKPLEALRKDGVFLVEVVGLLLFLFENLADFGSFLERSELGTHVEMENLKNPLLVLKGIGNHAENACLTLIIKFLGNLQEQQHQVESIVVLLLVLDGGDFSDIRDDSLDHSKLDHSGDKHLISLM
jgi:hypothetical protein